MSESNPQPDYLAPYCDAIEQFGPGFDATLWRSREGQVRRFDVLIDLGGVASHRLLDVGCGVGDLVHRLVERGIPFTSYVGVDALPGMIEAARTIEDSRCRFEVADVLQEPDLLVESEADFILVSGTLNSMDEADARELMEQAFAAARVGVVFNFLSNRVEADMDGDVSPASRFDTADWLDWAMSRTSLVRFTQAYFRGHDASIAMFQELD